MSLLDLSSAPPPDLELASGPSVQPWETDEDAERYAADPRAYMFARCKAFMDDVQLYPNAVITAIYQMPPFREIVGPNGTVTRFFLSDTSRQESIWQAKCGLVIAKGPAAFVDDDYNKFYGFHPQIGDWIIHKRGAGREITLRRTPCREMKDVEVVGIISNPAIVY